MDFSSYGGGRDDWFRNLKRHKYENANNENFFLSIDDALDFTGDNSRYQKLTNYIFSFQYAIYSFLMMGFPLLLAKPTFICSNGRPCKEKEACSQNDYTTVKPSNNLSITVEFELYCEDSDLNGLLGSLLFAGSFLAFLFFPYIGNWKGRKFGMVLAIFLSGLFALTVGLSDLFIVEEYREYVIYLLMAVLIVCGFAYSGFETLCYSYTAEISGERFRNISSVTMGTVWSVAQIVVATLFEFSGDWRYVFIFIMATPWIVSLLPLIRYVYETPRFLNAKKRYVEARNVINKICAINRRPDLRARLYGEMEFENSKVLTLAPRSRTTEQKKSEEQNSGYIALFMQPQLRTTTLILLYVWFFRNFTYFGLNYSLPILGMELYQNFKIAAISETIAVLLAGKIKFMMERIRSLCYSLILVSVCCLLSVFFPIPKECYEENEFCYQKTLSVIFAVIAKFCIGLFANILVTYTTESYPTEFRSLGLGLTMTASQIGTVAMPFIITKMNEEDINPLILFGGMGIFSLILIIWCLPETKNKLFRHFLLELKNRGGRGQDQELEMKSMGEPLLSKQKSKV